ncbi:MAG: hypothetical protein U9O82_09565 [Thermodesulfobacteriota bacterium]|nr:hypothetical protein [Thermodesulfobacteriota bacterium]
MNFKRASLSPTLPIFMVTHDVDEAIFLSDRMMLMSPGPEAKIMDELIIDIPRPRTKETIIEHPAYYDIRNRIIKFLSQKKDISPKVKLAA